MGGTHSDIMKALVASRGVEDTSNGHSIHDFMRLLDLEVMVMRENLNAIDICMVGAYTFKQTDFLQFICMCESDIPSLTLCYKLSGHPKFYLSYG